MGEPSMGQVGDCTMNRYKRMTKAQLIEEVVAQRDSRERFEAIVEGSRDAVFISDESSCFVLANAAACELTGYSKEELLEMRIPDLHEEVDLNAYNVHHASIMDGRETLTESDVLRKDGAKVATEFNNRRIVIAGTPYMHTVARDISQRRMVEDERRESERELRAILESTADGILVVDLEGHVIHTNKRFGKLWRIPPELIDAGDDQRLLDSVLDQLEYPEEFLEDVRRLYAGADSSLDTIGFKDGRVFERYSRPLVRGGHPSGRVWSFRDVTERKQAEAVQHRLGAIVQSSTDLLAMADEDHRYLAVNQTFLDYLGRTSDQVLGHTASEVFGEDVYGAVMRGHAERCLAGEEVHYQTWYDFPARGKAFVDIRYCPYESVDGRDRGFVIATRNITELERARMQLQEMNLGLEQLVAERTEALVTANQELEAFAYSVSHDLKAPLRAIDGYSAMLEEAHEASLSEEGQRLLGVVRSNAKQMARLIDDVLAITRIGRTEMVVAEVDMGEAAQAVFSRLMRLEGERTVDLSIGKLPTIQGDMALLQQVWANLLGNALKFTGGREVARIEVDCQAEPDHWIFSVRDNGAGFDMDYVDKLFGVFQRLHHAEEFPGTGVGLATVQRIIERHGGEVWAEAEVDVGATIYFRLPRTVGPEDSA